MSIASHLAIGNHAAVSAGDAVSSCGAAASGPMLYASIRKKFSRSRDGGFHMEAEFRIPSGVTIVFGPSGAGKSTLLRCISGIYCPDEGIVSVGDHVFFDSRANINIDPAKRRVAFVFQELALFPHLTVEQNAAFGLRRFSRGEREDRTSKVLQSFQISHLRRRKPSEVSGGERQRVALARSLVTEPCALLLDEPLSSLDATVKAGVLDDLRAWNAERGIPILYVTHDREEATGLGERMMLLERGRITAQGSPVEVLDLPRRETIARLSGFENILDAEIVAINESNGTMTCRPFASSLASTGPAGAGAGCSAANATLEIPLTRVSSNSHVRIAIRAGDIILATARPEKLSARNILPGEVVEITRSGARVTVAVMCDGVTFLSHVTTGAAESLNLRPGCSAWLVIKSYSCQVLAPSAEIKQASSRGVDMIGMGG